MNSKDFGYLLASLCIAASLSGCGGGGGGSGDDDADIEAPIEASLRGNAAKGIVIEGKVTARELDAAGTVTRTLGRATTRADGSYSLDLKKAYKGGPILLEITDSPRTTMVCDAPAGCGTRTDGLTSADDPDNNDDGLIDFGEEYKPANLSMTALLADAEDGETIDIQLTPYTHMAAQQVLGSRSIDAAAINTANAKVSNLLGGVDILRTEPVDITDPARVAAAGALDVAYAALGAALVELATDDANGQPDLDQVLADLAAGFAGGNFTASAMQQILDQAISTLAATGAVDTSGLFNAIQAQVDDAIANNGGIIEPDPAPNPNATDVALAKYFISDLRTWSTVIGDELDAPSEAFETQLDLASEAADMTGDAEAAALRAGIDAVMDFMDGILAGGDLTNHITDSGTFTAGTISEARVADGVEYTIANASVDTDRGPASLDLVLVAPEDDTQTSRIVIGVKSATAEGANARWVVDGGVVTADLLQPYDVDYDLAELPQPFIDVFAFDLDLSRTQKTTLANGLPVPAADPVTFDGNLSFDFYTVNDSNGEVLAGVPGSVVLSGSIGNTGGDSLRFDFAVSIPNAATLMPLGPVYDLHSTYADNNGGQRLISWQYGVNSFTYDAVGYGFSFTFNPGDGSVDIVFTSDFGYMDSYTDFGPYASIDAFVAAEMFYYEDRFTSSVRIDGQGEYERSGFSHDYSLDGFVEFTLEEAEVDFFDATQPGIGTVGLQFDATFDGLPEANISLTANSTGFKKGNARLTISYGNRRLVLDGSNETGPEAGKLEITNQDGVKLLVDFDDFADGDSINDITINNKVIGTLQQLDGGAIKISYIDGSFEIF